MPGWLVAVRGLTGMQCVSFQLSVSRAGRGEQIAFATRRRLAADRSLRLAMEFWADDTREHRVQVLDEPPLGGARVIAACTAAAAGEGGLLSVELLLPPLGTAGLHRLLLDVDGERVLSLPVGVAVRNVIARGLRSRYKGRGSLTT